MADFRRVTGGGPAVNLDQAREVVPGEGQAYLLGFEDGTAREVPGEGSVKVKWADGSWTVYDGADAERWLAWLRGLPVLG